MARVTKPGSTSEPAAEPQGAARVLKVLFLDEKGETVGEHISQQLPEDPFQGMSGIQEPPFSMEWLTVLAEIHPVHSAALEQKTADIVGRGWEWEEPEIPIEGEEGGEAEADEGARDEISKWFEELAPDDADMREIVAAAVLDLETVGWGLIEFARDTQGIVRRAYHVPAQTCRAHKDGFRLVQIRDNRKVWFTRWGAELEPDKPAVVDAKTGSLTSIRTPGNDLFVIRKPTRRSSWYGIPGYISSVGWISLALAARDDNLLFFQNRREPRWAIIMTNLQDDANIADDIRRAFTVDLAQPHRNILIPIAGEGKIDFQKLSDNQKDGSFDKLSERADKAIMIAHRVPAERLANSQVGPLGGNATFAASRIYKEGVVTPIQEILAARLNRFIAVEYKRATQQEPGWHLVMDDLDVQSDQEELELAVSAFKADIINLREARQRLRLGPLRENEEDGDTPDNESVYNDMLYTELPGVGGKAAGGGANEEGGPNPQGFPQPPPGVLEDDVRELLANSRDMNDRLSELVDDDRS